MRFYMVVGCAIVEVASALVAVVLVKADIAVASVLEIAAGTLSVTAQNVTAKS